jgi:hypothetical protein
MFDIPVVLFIFKRKDTLKRIIDRIKHVSPCKIYIIADGPRNEEEAVATKEVREYIETLIDWECEIVKNYSVENKGVYDRIGCGAKWVFTQENMAIFLEDDNLPEITFFDYCREMLELYKSDNRVLWVCGTNYLVESKESNGASYYFTQHLLPCGWASWANKFNKYYDGELDLVSDISLNAIKDSYQDKNLFEQDKDVVLKTQSFLKNNRKRASWDRQMLFSLRVNSLYGISPIYNQIRNIGADELSTHGGTSTNKTMTGRFCELATKPLQFPLKHPKYFLADSDYEMKTGYIILYPWYRRISLQFFRFIKPLLGLKRNESFVIKYQEFKNKHNK